MKKRIILLVLCLIAVAGLGARASWDSHPQHSTHASWDQGMVG